ncbi:FAD-binding and (Fe-S)-binding domain-containing protein [Actinomadura viridis]|uniref:FAD-binding and (Fe-S)-binding domain-containing protein n=1 Tax=Actinomadura viridis TaxID=58110 RepID=UPI0036CA3AA6
MDHRSSTVRELRRLVRGEVDDSTRRRAEYSTDASNYRIVPAAVVFPKDIDDVLAVARVCGDGGTPLTARGGGTSVAGNAIGSGVVLDFSRHLSRVVSVDADARTAVVEPGVVLDDLQTAARPHGLRFGPDPSTHARCTLGGMIGNNACGSRSIAYGRTADNVVELDFLDGTGRRFTAGRSLDPVPGLDSFVRRHLGTFRTELGRFGRQVSGYSLEHLLPERGGDLAKALVGTEGTCGLVLSATVRLVPKPAARALAVLGYPDAAAAADAVPALLKEGPLAVEGLDARIVDVVRRRRGAASVPPLPEGGGLLYVEAEGPTPDEALAAARRLAAAGGTDRVQITGDAARMRALWRIREDGAGLAGRTAAGAPAWPGWEDAAVPPERLGSYLRAFEALSRQHRVDGLTYGHFGEGCIHVRLDLPIADHPERFRSFIHEAAVLVAEHGGSPSGEHGDGRARGELLSLMYSRTAIDAFAEFRRMLDPAGNLNPGVIVEPDRLDANLRLPAARPLPMAGAFRLPHDGGDLARAVHRCVGVGKCRADDTASGGFMCPSFLATGDEKDSTRGRARVLQEMANGSLIKGGWRAPEVHEALDLCLSCKACSSDCPAGVDMATYKSQILHQRYRRRPRPVSHYSLGWLPRWTRPAGRAPRTVNALLRQTTLRRAMMRLAGLDPRRAVPGFAEETFGRWWLDRPVPISPGERRGRVVLWVDSFSEAFSPHVGQAAVSVLEAAGYEVLVPRGPACCGLTWITTGQLGGARRRLRGLLERLAPYASAGIPIVGLEPSCVAVIRKDLAELLPEDERVEGVRAATRTLAELLTGPGPRNTAWELPRLDGVRLLVQPHCHHHAVMTFDADRALLAACGAQVDTLAGCCGMAGNFGMERGHYDVSVAVAEQALLPALRAKRDDTGLLADGFSCRTQIEGLTGQKGIHLAELLAAHLNKE